jgi:hippurate hydrolase
MISSTERRLVDTLVITSSKHPQENYIFSRQFSTSIFGRIAIKHTALPSRNKMTSHSNTSFCALDDLVGSAEEMRSIRHHIHQHPELAYEEFNTAALVSELLTAWGYEVTAGVGGTGVVGTLKRGEGPRRIGIRADMDALPITENTGLSYASVHNGKMHACGHDGHTTMALGAAKYLAETKRFSGTVHFYFQPAEESGVNSGARAMIKDGLFERFPCDAVFAVHNHPGVPTGQLLFRTGPIMAAGDKAYITVKGVGGHAARPHMTIDPLVAAASIVMALQTVVSRNIDPTETAVVTIGVLHAGTATNVIPGTARIELGVRSFNPAVRSKLRERIIDIVRAQAQSYGASAEIDYVEGYPVVLNTEKETAFAIQVAEELVGADNVVPQIGLLTGSEDFAYMLQERPGCLLRIGNGGSASNGASLLHNAGYDFNDANLPVGAAYWARLVERFLNSPVEIAP